MVDRGHQQVFANDSRLNRATDIGVVSLCLSCRDASTDVQHDLPRSTCDLYTRANIDPDLSRSQCIYFDAPCREEHDGARIMPLAFLVRKFFAKRFCQEIVIFTVFDPCRLSR